MSDQRANVIALIEKGLHCFSIGQFEEARYLWNQALAIEPHNAQVLEFLQYVSPQVPSTPPGGSPVPQTVPHHQGHMTSGYAAQGTHGNTGNPAGLRWNSWSPSQSNKHPSASYEAMKEASSYSDAQEAWLPQEEEYPPYHQGSPSGSGQHQTTPAERPDSDSYPSSEQRGHSSGGYSAHEPTPAPPAESGGGGWLQQGLYNQPGRSDSANPPNPPNPPKPDLSTQFLTPLPDMTVNPHALVDDNTIQSAIPAEILAGNYQEPLSQGDASYHGHASGQHTYHDDLAAPDDAFSSEFAPPQPLAPYSSSHEHGPHGFAGPTSESLEQPSFAAASLEQPSFAAPRSKNQLTTQFFEPLPTSPSNFLPPEEMGLDASGEFLSGPEDGAYSYGTPRPINIDVDVDEVPFFQEEPLIPQQAAVRFQQDGSFANIEAVPAPSPQTGHEQSQHNGQDHDPNNGYSYGHDQGHGANADGHHTQLSEPMQPEPLGNTVEHANHAPAEPQHNHTAEQPTFHPPGFEDDNDLEFLLGEDNSSIPKEWEDVDEAEIMQAFSEDSLELVFQDDHRTAPKEANTVFNQEPVAYAKGTHLNQPPAVVIPGANDDTPPAGVDAFQPDRPPVAVRQSQASLNAAPAGHVINTDNPFEGMHDSEPNLAETMLFEPPPAGSTSEHDAVNVFDMPTSAVAAGESDDASMGEELTILLSGIEDLLAEEDFIGAKELLDVAIQQAPENPKIKILYDLCEKKVSEIFREDIQSLDATPRLAMDMTTVLEMRLNHRDGYILSQVDGLTSIADLLAISGFDEDELFMILGQLAHRGVVEWV